MDHLAWCINVHGAGWPNSCRYQGIWPGSKTCTLWDHGGDSLRLRVRGALITSRSVGSASGSAAITFSRNCCKNSGSSHSEGMVNRECDCRDHREIGRMDQEAIDPSTSDGDTMFPSARSSVAARGRAGGSRNPVPQPLEVCVVIGRIDAMSAEMTVRFSSGCSR